MKFPALLFLFVILPFQAWLQKYSFIEYNTQEGLPQSQVQAITQDKNGYLWVGTLGGLAKFNGKEFQVFSSENGLLNNRITFLCYIGNTLWIGHEGGISSYQNKQFTNWRLPLKYVTTSVSGIIQFSDKLIVTTNGGGIFTLTPDGLISIDITVQNPGKQFNSEDALRIRTQLVQGNTLLLGTRSGVINTTDLKNFRIIPGLSGLNISGMENQQQFLYLTTYNNLLTYNLQTKKTTASTAIDTSLTIRNCVTDHQGNLWVLTNNGIFELNNGKKILELTTKNGLPIESIRCFYEDREGNIWLGSEGKGLLRFTGKKFIYYNESSGLKSELILSVNQAKDGTYYLGTFNQGIITMKSNQVQNVLQFKHSNTIWRVLPDVGGKTWVGTGTGLVELQGNRMLHTYYFEDGLPGDKIMALYKNSPNTFYIGGSDGVSIYTNNHFYELKSPEGYLTIRDFSIYNGSVYCASDKGLFKVTGRKLKRITEFNKTIYSLESDLYGRLWIGTEDGLFYYDGKEIKAVRFSGSPASNYINFLNSYKDKLYIGTNNGIFTIFNLNSLKWKVANFGIAEGLINLETNLNSGYIDTDGSLWFGTAAGLVHFFPGNKLSDATTPPKLILQSILINFQQGELKNYVRGKMINGVPERLELPHSKNNITIELDAISLANYPGMKFQYWLEGSGNYWSPASSSAVIAINGLNAGKYMLHARCIDSKGIYSNEIIMPLTIKEAFYKTWWFILSVIMLLVLLTLWYFRFRITREREKNELESLEYKSRLLALEQKSLNASMNRHFIFNSLNSIQYFINTQDRKAANRFLTNFAKLIRKNLDSSDEGNMVTLQQELERLELYLSLESMRFQGKFDYQIDCAPEIDTESIVIPAMMLQPFIENSLIHGILPDESKKGMIRVHITHDQHVLTIDIEDNGIGIDNSRKNKGLQDGDHKSQGMEITSKRIELLRKVFSKKFELNGPRQLNNPDGSVKGTRVTLKFETE